MSADQNQPDRKLPLDAWHRAKGARMVSFAGYEMPIQYEGIIAEHRWTRENAGLFDVSHMGQVIIAGRDAEWALEAMLPADLKILKDSTPKYSLLLTDTGGIIDDLMVTRRGDHFYLVVNGATKEGDIDHMRSLLPANAFLDHMKDQGLLALQGPKAAAVLSALAPGVENLTFMTAASFEIAGTPCWISRSGYTGEDGYEISVPGTKVAAVADAIAASPDVKPIGLGARDSLRLEAGLPLYGHDIDLTTTPVEAGLTFALSKRRRAEGGYPGAQRLATELADGPIRKRVGLVIEGRQPVREGCVVLNDEGTEVGKVTSGGFSPTLEKPIAMAYVPAASAAVGSTVIVEQRGKIFKGQVVAMPFVPHKYHRKGAA